MKYLDENGLLYFAQKIKAWLGNKVDKIDGKGLSTNDFTTTLKNKLDGIAAGANVNVQADWNATSGDAFIKNKPTIPAGAKLYSSTGQNTDGAMTQKAITDALGGKANSSHTHDDRYYTESEVDTKLGGKANSSHNHDDRYYTESEVDTKLGGKANSSHDHDDRYYDMANVDALLEGVMTTMDTAISDAISGVTQFDYEVVTSLPTTGVKGKIYLKAHSHGTGDAYDEYIWTGSAFEKIGNTDIDLSGYVTLTLLGTRLNSKVDKVEGKGLSTNDFTTALKNKLDSIDASGYVPITRKVNNKALSGDITLNGTDILHAQTGFSISTVIAKLSGDKLDASDVVAITNAEIDTICS